MNFNDEYNIASRYRTIRKHLDSLGYRQALSLDALPLIEKLLADLIQTTDSLKHFKTVAQDNLETCSQLQLSIDPYKCDNARLTQECNQLHHDLIEARETYQKQVKDLKKKCYNLECECNDLQLASSRNLKRIKELEAESAQKSKKIQELLGKCCKPLISNAALASRKRPCYPLRKPTLQANPLPRAKGPSSLPTLSKVEPRFVDLLAMADRKMNSLNHELTRLNGELSLQIDNVCTLKSQLGIKEKEISRLKKMLEGGRPHTAVSKDCSCKKNGQCNEYNEHEKTSDVYCACHKGSETDELTILQQVKSDLEQQLREALDKQHDVMSQAMKLAERNEELEKELRDIDHIALAVEADCNSAVKENNKRVSQVQEKLASVMTQVHVLEGELMVERRCGQELRADLEAARLENRTLQRKLESTSDEKKKMTNRINELTMIEQSLNDEIQRLSRENGNLRQEVIRLDCANDLLKEQMHDSVVMQNVMEDVKGVKEKGEKNDKNKGKMLTKKKQLASRERRSLSPPVQEKQTETTRRHVNGKDNEVTRDIDAAKSKAQKLHNDKDAKIIQLQSTIDQVQEDRDYYKNEYNRLREKLSKNAEVDNAELWSQVCELRRQLIDKEHTVLELQREKKELCKEKFELELQLQSARSDRRNAHHPCGQCRPIGNCACSSSALSTGVEPKPSITLERLERERDAARADVDRLVEERDALRERLKLAVEAHKFEQHRLRQNLCDVETRLSQLERERQDLLLAQGMQRGTIEGFEDQLEDLKEELRRTKQELTTQRTQCFQLRVLQDQADQALGDVQNQLSQSEAELYKAMDRNRVVEQQRLQLESDVKGLKQELSMMRANVSGANQEKDQILAQLDDKSKRIAFLERELKTKEQEAATMEQQFQELQQKNLLCVDQSAEQERRLRNMQMKMEIDQRQLAAASSDRDNAAQENRRLQDDLAAVTCEIRNLQRELEVSRAESYDLKKRLQAYVNEVQRAEELINRKENERTEMLNHFRSLSLEATMLENNNHSLESEAAEARGALQAEQDRSLDLERQLADRDCMIRGYETQITELTQTVASLETQIRQQMDQRQRAEADLNAVRDLCVKLDQQKETLVKELGDKDATKAQYEAQLARLRAEQNMVQDQINRDHVTVERLENMLAEARQESMDSQANNQKLQCEMSRLKQRMCELQNKLSAESAELRRYQNQTAEYSKTIIDLRREMTNERFDRARKEEEHRRYAQSGKTEEYRARDDLRNEAQRTNRFFTNTVNKDISTGQIDREGAQTRSTRVIDEAICGGLCVRATLEEDTNHQDIRVQISDSSACPNFEAGQNKPTVVKFCTPLVCKKTNQRDVFANEAVSSDPTNSSDVILVENREIEQGNKADGASLTTINGNKITTHSENTSDEGNKLEPSVETKRVISPVDDDTSGYNTSESPNCFCGNRESVDKNETPAANDTLRKLHSLLEDAIQTDQTSVRKRCERSRSVPRGKSRERDFDFVRSNLSFPVRVDYSEATLTAADLTRPKFVQMLTEIKEHARNLERQLSRINSVMRNPSLNTAFSDITDVAKKEKNEVAGTSDQVDGDPTASFKTATSGYSNDLPSSNSTVGMDTEKKMAKRKKKNNNASSQSDIPYDESTSPLTPKKSKKIGIKLSEKTKKGKARVTEEELPSAEQLREAKHSDIMNPSSSRLKRDPNDGMAISNNLQSDGTQTSVNRSSGFPESMNESVMVKPSRIHTLKKPTSASNDMSMGRITCIEDPENFPCSKGRYVSSRASRSPTRFDGLSEGSTSKSIIHKRQVSPEKPRSVSTQSSETRTTAATSVADLPLIAPPQTPVDSECEPEDQRSRRGFLVCCATPAAHNSSSSRRPQDSTKSYNQTDHKSRINDSSQSRQFDNPVGKPVERRPSRTPYSKDGGSIGNQRRQLRSLSRSPATRSQNVDPKQDLSLNYSSNNKRVERAIIANPVNNFSGKVGNNPTSKDEKSKVHQRSRSDPHGSRNHSGQGSR